jgi:hypothetical protein
MATDSSPDIEHEIRHGYDAVEYVPGTGQPRMSNTHGRLAVAAREALYAKYRRRIEVNRSINRSLVSNQSNRGRPVYRWFKYKEGFSAGLVDYVFDQLGAGTQDVLDPFAGTGVALFGTQARGCNAKGIELLPVGVHAINARLAATRVAPTEFRDAVTQVRAGAWRKNGDPHQ